MSKAKNNTYAALRAEELRAKAAGFYVEKKLNLNKNVNSLDEMTEEQLDARLKEIENYAERIAYVKESEYDPKVHDKTDD